MSTDNEIVDRSTGRVKNRGHGGQRPGSSNSQAKFTDNDIEMMRRYRADPEAGWSYKELALLFGCAPTTAAAICTGKAYVDAPGPIIKGKYNSGKRPLKRLV